MAQLVNAGAVQETKIEGLQEENRALWALVKKTRIAAARDRRKIRRWRSEAKKRAKVAEQLAEKFEEKEKRVKVSSTKEGKVCAFQEVERVLELTLGVAEKREKKATAKQVLKVSQSLVRQMREEEEGIMVLENVA